jgi:YesN/AraC family two-component response regulator
MLESFEFNSIDYLLKPITEEKLNRALDKVKKLEQHFFSGQYFKTDSTKKLQPREELLPVRELSLWLSIQMKLPTSSPTTKLFSFGILRAGK